MLEEEDSLLVTSVPFPLADSAVAGAASDSVSIASSELVDDEGFERVVLRKSSSDRQMKIERS